MNKQGKTLNQEGYEYDTLMNLLQVSVSKHLINKDYTLVWANDYYYDLIGYTKEEYELLYHNLPSFYYMNDALGIHDDDLWNQLGTEVVKALSAGKNGYTHVTQMRQNGGGYIWVRMTARFTDEYIDGYRVSYTAMTDVSDIMRMQQEQSVTYNNLPGFVAKYRVQKDFKFKFLDANDKFFTFFGDKSCNGEEDPLYCDNVARNMTVFQEYKETLLAGNPVHFTAKMKDQFGHDAWLQINASCVEYQDDDPVYLVVYIDITNETELRHMQKKLEKQAEQLGIALKEAEKANRAKSDFLSKMSHDIRTPLNAVLGMKDIAETHLDDREKVEDCLKKIGLSGQHLLGLINDVLDMSKIESGEMILREDVMSLPEVLTNIVAIMQPQFKEKNQQFSIRLQCVVHEKFLSDALRLRQIFLNILSNAYKFTPAEGKITMDVQELSAELGIAKFVFTITDSGIGMKPEFLSQIFSAFSREQDSRVDKTEGTGLGMAITKKIVDLLRGTIVVESEQGKGSTFRVTLPLKITDVPFVERAFPDLKVLVVDDDTIMCEHTIEMLHQMGIHADWVHAGKLAVQKIEETERLGEAYDAILLDWKMPEQDGLETARRIRQSCEQTLPILIISAYDWSDIANNAKEIGVSGFLQKPIFASTLVHSLQRYVLGEQPILDTEALHQINFADRHFLLVEDNAINREVAMELLKDMGASVDVAVDGKNGVEIFEQADVGYYDIIFMDVQMPVMNGYIATKIIRKLDRSDAKSVPILAMTADAFAEDIQLAKEAGMNGHLAKPLDRITLKREINKYL